MANFDVIEDLVRKLAKILEDTGLTEIEYRVGEEKIRVSRAARSISVSAPETYTPGLLEESSAVGDLHPGAVKAPMVGVIYLAPEPGAKPFVSVGDEIHAGETMFIIEAMKTMNHIPSSQDGIVKKICVDDGQPVEFGQNLIIFE